VPFLKTRTENAASLFVEATAVDFHGISGEVEKLHQENEKYNQLNNELKATSSELKNEVGKLHGENDEYKKLNGELKGTSTELKEQVIKFENKVKILSDELHNLQKTREALDAAVTKSEQQNQKLSEEIGKLHSVEEGLRQFAQKQGADYENFVNNLTGSINKHQQLLKDFAAENEKLKQNRRQIEIDSMISLSNNFQMLDGKVGLSIEEFQSYLDMLGPEFENKIKAKAPQQNLQALFSSLDKDHNGSLNIPELRHFLESTVAQ
jgi:mitofilin